MLVLSENYVKNYVKNYIAVVLAHHFNYIIFGGNYQVVLRILS